MFVRSVLIAIIFGTFIGVSASSIFSSIFLINQYGILTQIVLLLVGVFTLVVSALIAAWDIYMTYDYATNM